MKLNLLHPFFYECKVFMKYFEKVPAAILLEDGRVFTGYSAGKIGTTTGEVCFNTGMTGYQEIFTDPSYFGQVIAMTNVHVGNYGVRPSESESGNVQIKGLITRNFTNLFSRHQAESDIQEYLLTENIVAITGVDTRALVMHIRDKGAMNCVISSENTDIEFLRAELAKAPKMDGLELSSKVTTEEAYCVGEESAELRVAVLDLGVKKSILDNLVARGCYLKVFPAKASIDEIKAFEPHGYFASNGPGDPGVMQYAVDTVKGMLETDTPFFGICLGHQIFARSQGVGTYKMHNGHRGINHPIKNLDTGKCEMTSQNHGFSISREDVESNTDLKITHVNLNDDTVEGIMHKTKSAFSVQFHPEASPGTNDSKYLFDQFINTIKERLHVLN